MKLPTQLTSIFLLHSALVGLLDAQIVNGRQCPRKADLERCTAVHRSTFNEIIGNYGSLLGGVDISDLHRLCNTYNEALKCVKRLEKECTMREIAPSSPWTKRLQLHNISSICNTRASGSLEMYALHHGTCFLKSEVKNDVNECWNVFEDSVGVAGVNMKLVPKSELYSLAPSKNNSSSPSRTDAPGAGILRSGAPEVLHGAAVSAAICRLYSCLKTATVSCMSGAKSLVESLALPLAPFNKMQHSFNCTLTFNITQRDSAERRQSVRLRKESTSSGPGNRSAGRTNAAANVAKLLSSDGCRSRITGDNCSWWFVLLTGLFLSLRLNAVFCVRSVYSL